MTLKTNEHKILTLNLNGKKGVNIDLEKYTLTKDEIVLQLSKTDELEMTKLGELVKNSISEKFDGKIGWYFMAVKLDLEAREIIERVPKSSPQKLRIKK